MKGKILLVGFLALAVVLSGCVEPVACTEEARLCPDGSSVARNPALNCEFDPCPVVGNPVVEFSSGECDQSIDPYNSEEHGIKETSWLDDTTLQVKAIVSINCAEAIESGDFEISEEKITLVYNSPKCGEMCALCMCAHELEYKFSNVERKEYSFELKRTEEQGCKKEGESIPVIADPPECCTGLELIPPKEEMIVGISGYCTAECGNGTCDGIESSYNCPEDCVGEIDVCEKDREFSESVSSDPGCAGQDFICVDGWETMAYYDNRLTDTVQSEEEALGGTDTPQDVQEATVATYSKSSCSCEKPVSYQILEEGVLAETDCETFIIFIQEYFNDCEGCLLNWITGCC